MAEKQKHPDEVSARPILPEKLNPVAYRILSETAPELASYYLGAHKMLEDVSNPERVPAAAHSLRELIEKLPDRNKRAVKIDKPVSIFALPIHDVSDMWVQLEIDKTNPGAWLLQPADKATRFLRKSEVLWKSFRKHYPTREEKRLKFLEGVRKGVPLPTELQQQHLELWGEYYSVFADIAHHREPRNSFKGKPFGQLVQSFEDFIIRELEPQTTKDYSRISQLIGEFEKGIEENLPELVGLVVANRPNYDHFFFTINSPKWLKVLKDNQWTGHIDEPIPTEEGGQLQLSWAPGIYYEKIAKDAAVEIAAIITSLPPTTNTRAHMQMLDIAKNMPKEQAVCIMPLIEGWLKGEGFNNRGLVPFKVGDFIVSLAEQGDYDDAISVFRILFELQEPPEKDIIFRHPETLTSDTSYKTILKSTVPPLLKLNGPGVIKELCDLLESGLVIEERDKRTEKNGIIYDGSSIWRPNIRSQKYDHEPNEILVSRIYRSMTTYAETDEQKLSIVEILTSYKSEVFHRIAATLAEGSNHPELKRIYAEIVEKVGEPNGQDYITSESTVMPALSLDDMRKLPPEELIKLLNTWDPQENLPGFGRSKSDIGFVLSQYVQERPSLLKELFESDEKLSSEYYSYIFMGTRMASDNKQVVVDWEPVLKYGLQFIESSNTHDSEGHERQGQYDLMGAVESGVNQDHLQITNPELAERVLAILTPLCSHVEPTVEYEAERDKGRRADSVGLAINTMRGSALEALIAVLKNASRNGKKHAKSSLTKEQRGMVYGVLEKHLDITTEPTLAIRTVYARELPFLAYDNKRWVAQNLPRLFPSDAQHLDYFVDAMEAFLLFARLYPEMFPLVAPYMIEYMKRVQKEEIKGDDDGVINHLVGQILHLFIDGFVKLDDPIMQELFKMPDAYLEEAMEYFGRGIKQTTGTRQKLILKRAKEYWQKRLDLGEARKVEYSQFGWWLRASAADAWIKEQFSSALRQTDKMDALYFVADELVDLARIDEAGAAKALLEIVDTQHNDNLISVLHTPGIKDAIKNMLASDDSVVTEEMTRVVDMLCSRGFYDFKDLLDSPAKPAA